MARKYYTLVVRDEDNNWSAEFGDYDKSVVYEEQEDYIDAGTYKAKNTRIIATGDKQADINDAIAKLNADWRNA